MAITPQLDKRERIKSATVACIRRFGARRTSMDDIAEAAQVSRRTLYYVFKSRRDLMIDILYDRIERIAIKVEKAIDECSNFADAIVRSSIMTIGLVTSDKIYQSLYDEDSSFHILSNKDSASDRFDQVTLTIFANAIAMGRSEGTIREALSDHEIADWIQSFHYLLIAHKLTSPEEIETMVRKFFLPSVR